MQNILIVVAEPEFIPEQKTDGAVCMDLKITQDIEILPGKIQVVGAGIKTVIPDGWHSKVYARSGLPTKQGCTLANAVAVFDSDYRGEYLIQLWNISDTIQIISKGTRVAQIEFCPHYIHGIKQFGTQEVPGLEIVVDQRMYDNLNDLYPSIRGTGALHSTGK